MKHILFDLFLFSLGAAAEREIEMMERAENNEFRTELIQLVFI